MGFKIEVKETEITGVKVIIPSVFKDKRGELWTFTEFPDSPINLNFNHVKFARNRKGVLRGIHGDYKSSKLVTLISGKIQQVVVDLRGDSATYKKHLSWIIEEENPFQILLPAGVGNAFLSLEDSSYCYALAYEDSYSDHDKQFTYPWNCGELGINWLIKNPILSNRDSSIKPSGV